ncbi:uncharacterized protein LOC142333137 isoform X2 [Lycorma delicatula]|uniref:uncharacterized protein LOC142333137 isoform X2 n=1 Tax=Lycorma delicatula TaxID=130591 RepID=UPI003F514606
MFIGFNMSSNNAENNNSKDISTAEINEYSKVPQNDDTYIIVVGQHGDVNVSDDDDLPKNICNFCLSKLEICWAFRMQCLKSDKLMRELNQASKQFCEMTNTVSQLHKSKKKQDYTEKDKEDVTENHIVCHTNSENDNDSDNLLKIENSINNRNELNRNKNQRKISSIKHRKRKQVLTPVSWAKLRRSAHNVTDADNKNGIKSKNNKSISRYKSSICCEICGKRGSSEEEITEHKKEHSHEYPYNCKLCLRLFRTEGALTVHVRTNHKLKFTMYDNYRMVKCNICHVSIQKSVISDHYLEHRKKTISS